MRHLCISLPFALLFLALTPASRTVPEPPLPVCVRDSLSGQLRAADMPLTLLSGDSVMLATGQRTILSRVRPEIFGFGIPGGELATDSTCLPTTIPPRRLVRFLGRCFSSYDVRPLDPSLLDPAGQLKGASVFVERGIDRTRAVDVIYVLVEEDCRFRVYSHSYIN